MNFRTLHYLLTITLLLSLPNLATAKRGIWLDTDQLLGNPKDAPREVDDAIALIMILRYHQQLKLHGISLVTEVDYGYEITQRVLQHYWAGDAIPVYKGSDTCGDVGTENEATRALAAALRKRKLTILAIGPATDVATVLKNHPELGGQIEEIVFCAGRTPDYPFTLGLERVTVSDYNVDRDPEAFQVILDSGVPMVLSGFMASESLFFGETDYEFLAKGDAFEQYLYEQFIPWSKRMKLAFGIMGFVPWDTTPVGYLTHPKFFKYYEDIPTQLIQKENDATLPLIKNKKNRQKPYLEASYDYDSPHKTTFVYRTVLGFEEIVLECLKAEKPFGKGK
ncbi:MAG: nucleoside hydrolase [Bacteroidota bacterium]